MDANKPFLVIETGKVILCVKNYLAKSIVTEIFLVKF
jgi:hypothetical protein